MTRSKIRILKKEIKNCDDCFYSELNGYYQCNLVYYPNNALNENGKIPEWCPLPIKKEICK